MRGITKAFPGQLAVDDVSFELENGEIHALVGENGAGKSTLIKVLAGEHRPDAGIIEVAGVAVGIDHPSTALRHGIGFIHQEPALLPNLSITENVTFGSGYARGSVGLISWKRQRARAAEVLQRVGLGGLDPGTLLSALSAHEQQLVAIARVLLLAVNVVVLDEVTAPLSRAEVERLFTLLRGLRDEGVAVVYVSHRLEEIFALCDRVTVMRNGRRVTTSAVGDLTLHELTALIIARDPRKAVVDAPPAPRDQVLLRVDSLRDEVLRGISFELRAGEIIGLAGLGGAGRTNVLEVVFGARAPTEGTMTLDGAPYRPRHPADAIARGIALVTEDRKVDGFVGGFPLWQHITLPWLPRFTRGGSLRFSRERQAAAETTARLDVRAASLSTRMRELSGGNQQKAILARWLLGDLRILLLDEPTHGVDVGAKEEIYAIIRDLAARGVAVVLVSSEFEELETLCHRVILIREGAQVGVLRAPNLHRADMLAVLFTRESHEVTR